MSKSLVAEDALGLTPARDIVEMINNHADVLKPREHLFQVQIIGERIPRGVGWQRDLMSYLISICEQRHGKLERPNPRTISVFTT